MKKLLFILPILLSFSAYAQFGTQKIIAHTLNYPGDVISVDIDNDGDKDILGCDMFENLIVLYENLGGGLIDSVYLEVSDQAVGEIRLSISDLDGDGLIDVLSVSSDNKVAWYKNLGNLSFGPQQIITTMANRPNHVSSVDLDNDGDKDVISTSVNDSKIAWYENFGNGTFGPQQIISSGVIPNSNNFGDIDNDGDQDIVSSFYSTNKIVWFENLGGGVFGLQQTILSVNGPNTVHLTDINNDGKIDIVYSSFINARTSWALNLGSGNFGLGGIVTSNFASDIYSIDINNDGFKDIIMASDATDILSWFENISGVIDTTYNIISTNADRPFSVYSEDLDNDGDMEILFASLYKLAWYNNLGSGIIDTVENIIPSKPVNSPQKTFSIDLDNDGDNDVISASYNDNKISWYENLGGKFSYQKLISDTALGATSVYAIDIDNDGDNDVISASYLDDKISWYENDGVGNFLQEHILSTSVNQVFDLYAGDLDNDGDNDIVTGSNNALLIFENLGGGIFAAQNIIVSSVSSVRGVFLIDMDNDLDLDLIFASYNDSKIAWHENLGGLNFGPQQLIYSNNTPTSVFSADLDNDGDNDIISTSYNGDVSWSENLGSGIFGSKQIITTQAYQVRDANAVDIDGDGDIDVLSASGNNGIDDKIAWYENLGGGVFGPQNLLNTYLFKGSSVYSSDLDNDGDVDIISTSIDDNKIAWYENFFSSPRLKGKTFYDANQNKIIDVNEKGLSFIQTQLQPNVGYSFSDSLGNYFYSAKIGIPYVLSYSSFPNWSLTTDSINYNRTLTIPYQVIDSLNFGFYPDTILTIIEPDLTGGFPRCNDIVNYWANIQNQGTTLPSGLIHLQLHDSVSYVSAAVVPDSINGQNIYWHYDSLFFYSNEMINLQVQMPPFTSMGDTLTSYLTVHELDTFNNIVYTNVDTLEQILVCAYDPNDKSVTPKGIGTEGFIPQNQELEYLIRFQNTGNDTAITVMVRDQLDANLDWSTLQPIASSDPVQIWIEQDGEAVFKFQNIMLPDSGADFLGSQGFVKFKISPDTGLAPLTPIYNTGHIYFDNNPAVITNTVLNTIECYSAPLAVISYSFPYLNANVTGNYTYQWYLNGNPIAGANADTLLPLVDGNYTVEITDSNTCYKLSNPYNYVAVGIEELGKLKTVVYPNPFSESTTILFDKNLNGEYDLLVYDIVGKEVKHINKIAGNKVEISKNEIGKGLFLAYVVNRTTGEKIFIEKLIVQ